MNYILEGAATALRLMFRLDPDLMSAVAVSLKVTAGATVLASLIGVPAGVTIALGRFRGSRPIMVVLTTLMSVPTVTIGLLFYALLSHSGPFGELGLLYTPWAMILGQAALILPIVSALSLLAVEAVDERARRTAMALGASRRQAALLVLHEARPAIAAAVMFGFGRAFGEVGAAMMLGGNIRGYTRNITTTIVQQSQMGEFGLGIALGAVLLVIALAVNIAAHRLRGRKEAQS